VAFNRLCSKLGLRLVSRLTIWTKPCRFACFYEKVIKVKADVAALLNLFSDVGIDRVERTSSRAGVAPAEVQRHSRPTLSATSLEILNVAKERKKDSTHPDS